MKANPPWFAHPCIPDVAVPTWYEAALKMCWSSEHFICCSGFFFFSVSTKYQFLKFIYYKIIILEFLTCFYLLHRIIIYDFRKVFKE